MALPLLFDWDKAVSQWKAKIDPLIANTSNNASILKSIRLVVGDNIINHRLGKTLTGWRIVRKRANANIYDKQDTNQMPDLTLVLNSDAIVTIDVEVF